MSNSGLTTLAQLQQLNDAQLSVMCRNYRITPTFMTGRNRRHLERRLHVAIIEESAQQRALDYIAKEKDKDYQNDLYARSMGSEILPARPRVNTRSPSPGLYEISRSQNAGTMTTPSVHNIGGNRTLWPSPLPHNIGRTYKRQRVTQEPSILSSALAKAPGLLLNLAKEVPLRIWKGLEGQLAPFQRFRGGEQQSVQNIEVYQSNPQQQDDTTNRGVTRITHQLNNTFEEQPHTYPYGLDYEELQHYTQEPVNFADIETDQDEVSVDSMTTPHESDSIDSFHSSLDEMVEEKPAVKAKPNEQPMLSAFRFAWWRSPEKELALLPDRLETDRISEHEQELNTYEYLSDDQKLGEQRKEVKDIMGRVDLRDDSDDEAVITLPSRRQRILRSCGAFCRNVYEFLFCDRDGVWDIEKVRCTVFFCGMLVFLGASFRKMQ
ncbi:uncharacterized protein Dwil_GK27580 [Drosophila willistoni]|uniref:LEM domain-containing protein n=1 Tax=Drosophila willistoni TaxID=7260 RepID=A0A0Q9WTC4_DROWI|nr:uncharacterized protein LOC26529582 [Drosophila willistoni]KRF98813.1 uncharacterized protein Dwil_GK27580 [Drosophila willistoni]